MEKSITININNKVYTPKKAKSTATVCTNCAFSFEGRSQRTCPKANYVDEQSQKWVARNLCIIIDDDELTYFVESE